MLLACLLLATENFALNVQDITEKLQNSTVRINLWENYEATDPESYIGGSGIILNKVNNTYFILTNAHVLLSQFCLLDSVEEECENLPHDESITITVDTENSTYEYRIEEDEFIFWDDLDLAVIAIDGSLYEEIDNFQPLEIGGMWHPLMTVYAAGFPFVLGNNKNYRDIFYNSCVINAGIFDQEGLDELVNYSIVHNCDIAGGMSGGPLISQDGKLMAVNGIGGEAILEQGWKRDIIYSDFDGLKYSYAIHIYDLYEVVITSKSGNFDPQSKFYNFLPPLSLKDHGQLHDRLSDLAPSKSLLNKIFR